jgi:ABC-type amino acid transport system, permease component
MIFGLIVALASLTNNKFLTYFNITYVFFFRAIPLLVLFLGIYYGIPIMIGVSFNAIRIWNNSFDN